MRRLSAVLCAALVLLAAPTIASADTYLPLMLGGAGPASATPTATTQAPTATPTATATPRWVELVTDGGFEQGPASPWMQASAGSFQLIQPGVAFTGTYAAELCGYTNGYDALAQYVTVPANAIDAAIAFHYRITSADSASIVHDMLTVWLLNSNAQKVQLVTTVTNAEPRGIWTDAIQTASATAFKGQTVALHFECSNDSAFPTMFVLDNASFAVRVP